jgi:hypothetical protein
VTCSEFIEQRVVLEGGEPTGDLDSVQEPRTGCKLGQWLRVGVPATVDPGGRRVGTLRKQVIENQRLEGSRGPTLGFQQMDIVVEARKFDGRSRLSWHERTDSAGW